MQTIQVIGIVLGSVFALAVLAIPYRIICAWCKRDLGPISGTYENSHGICEDCCERLVSEE